jgi:acetoacetate decarboxylase
MFKFEDHKCYHMPAHFGGWDYSPVGTVYRDMVQISYTYTTDGNRLADYLPEGFALLRPELYLTYSQSREVEWLAGSAYNLIEVSAPVRVQGNQDREEGYFALVVWENKTAPILGGREETGIPKIYADIEDLHKIKQNYFTNASFEGNTFLRLEMHEAQPMDAPKLAKMKASPIEKVLFGWRYIPKIGGPGADLSQPTFYAQSLEVDNAWIGQGAVQWTQLKWEQNPSQWHIIKALAELPIIELTPPMMLKGVATLKSMQARVLK